MGIYTLKEWELIKFIRDRQNIYLKRKAGKPKPWTKDPILQQYRFCNIYREQDKVTEWISKNWRAYGKEDPDLWFAMLVARYINEPGTMEFMGYPIPWKNGAKNSFLHAIAERKRQGKNAYNAAYIISTGGQARPKHEYLADYFDRMWKQRKLLRPIAGDTLASFNERLVEMQGMGSFMSGQVIADLKYVQMTGVSDWWTFAVSGPGSRRGLNRIMSKPVKQSWKEEEWHADLSALRRVVNKEIMAYGLEKLHAQDLQNSLCEMDKYLRAKSGEGRPKQKYPGTQ